MCIWYDTGLNYITTGFESFRVHLKSNERQDSMYCMRRRCAHFLCTPRVQKSGLFISSSPYNESQHGAFINDKRLQASAIFAVASDFENRGAAEASLESSDAATQHTPAPKKSFSAKTTTQHNPIAPYQTHIRIHIFHIIDVVYTEAVCVFTFFRRRSTHFQQPPLVYQI